MLDVKAVAEAAAQAMKAHVAKVLAPILARLEAIEARPVPRDGESVPVEQVERMVAEAVTKAVAALPAPVQSPSGDEISVIVERAVNLAVQGIEPAIFEVPVRNAVEVAVAAVPKPKDGESVPVEQVERMVAEAVAALPAPVQSPSAEEISAMVERAVAEAVRGIEPPSVEEPVRNAVEAAISAIPLPKDGESVPVEQVERMVAEAVTEAVAGLPAPTNSPSEDEVAALVERSVAEAMQNMEPRSFEAPVRVAVEAAVAAIPTPKDGESVPVEQVQRMVDEAVAGALSLIPRPKDGESVPVEQVERMVSEAVTKAVAALPPALDGAPGRDAAHIEILPIIDEAKVYPRGTFATYKGGLWRSFETTSGMKGWECIVDGVARVDIAGQGRSILLTVAKASGAERVHPVTLPVMAYRGKWTAGTYETGDTVTAKGGIWHCDHQTDAEPGTGDGWTLAAKSGERGASAYTLALRHGFKGSEAEFVASLKGPQGEPGPRGRDLTQMGFSGEKH